jgi:predicted PurR-regulated permease PerM
MVTTKLVQYVFFFGFTGAVAFLVWKMFEPFVSALALSAIIVTICYPMYQKVLRFMPRQNETLAALVTTLLVIGIIFVPLFFLTSSLLSEALSIYGQSSVKSGGFEKGIVDFENALQQYIPNLELNTAEYVKQTAGWLATHLGAIFAGTATTIFLFFISIIGSFYLFKDGRSFTKHILRISPLPDTQDELIISRLSVAVRSVATGTLMVALLQGTLTGFGLWLFGFERVVLWGTLAAIGALIPGIGTTIVFIPSVIFLIVSEAYGSAIGLAIWGVLAVGLIDNLLGPYLMSRGNTLHPFVILLAVLGGMSVFGPIGFIVGPVVVSLLKVLLELYASHVIDDPITTSKTARRRK